MSPESAQRIREAVALSGKALEGRLPDSPHHPSRNPYAHIWRCIKTKMGKSYRECDDTQVEEILEHIRHLEQNPF